MQRRKEKEPKHTHVTQCILVPKMDVTNSNASDRVNKKFKSPTSNTNISRFSTEIYFIWFGVLIFLTETLVDFCLAGYYFHKYETDYAFITLCIIVVPAVLCQLYSLWLLRTDRDISGAALVTHILLLGIPYRYQNILRKIAKDRGIDEQAESAEIIIYRIRDVNAIQTVNAIFQYCPQFLFQSFLIIYRQYKCVITGVSAGLAGFSFLWHIFIHFYYLVKRFNHDYKLNDHLVIRPTAQVNGASNANSLVLTTSVGDTSELSGRQATAMAAHLPTNAANLEENLKNLGKPAYAIDDNNLIASKKNVPKNVEKRKLFTFNSKRRPIYEQEDFDMLETSNLSTVFFEVNESNCSSSSRIVAGHAGDANREADNFLSENQVNSIAPNSIFAGINSSGSLDNVSSCSDKKSCYMKATAVDNCLTDSSLSLTENRNSLFKRKGICSSQEMLHLVDIMNENISAEQVDVLAKSLDEIGAASDSLKSDFEHDIPDNDTLLELFPKVIDENILETIDAAIYENQIIFEERIRKNQLTIQNLKLQDQLLSKYIDDLKIVPFNETLSIRDYENMCFANIARQNRGMKHWRNYLHDINHHQHDNSTVQHSSFYVNTNTITNSLTDLYINENDLSFMNDKCRSGGQSSTTEAMDSMIGRASTTGDDSLLLPYKKTPQWQIAKIPSISNMSNCSFNGNASDDLYISMNSESIDSSFFPQKNILVETINKISIVDSPIKSLTISENHSDLGGKS